MKPSKITFYWINITIFLIIGRNLNMPQQMTLIWWTWGNISVTSGSSVFPRLDYIFKHSVYRSSSFKVSGKPPLIKCVCANVYWPGGFWLNPLLLLCSFWTSSVLCRENKPRRGVDRSCISVHFRPVNQRKRLLWRRRSLSCPPNNIFLRRGDKGKCVYSTLISASVCLLSFCSNVSRVHGLRRVFFTVESF